ncbi:hypothetical protein DV736_g1508, partial [Chaetothyriales sp. CBS 134916]
MGKESGLKPAAEVKTALLLVDTQQGLGTETAFFKTKQSTRQFKDNVAKLLLAARKYNAQVQRAKAAKDDGAKSIFIIHIKQQMQSRLVRLRWQRNRSVLSKTVNCGFIGTDLEKRLRDQKIRQLLILGISSDHCVSTTVRLAAVLEMVGPRDGGGLAIVSDASAAFNYGDKFDAETVHLVSLSSLEDEFAKVITTEEVLKQVIGGL